jgi:hypothetical protein
MPKTIDQLIEVTSLTGTEELVVSQGGVTKKSLLSRVKTYLGLDSLTATISELNKLAGTPVGLTSTELGYVDGVTSAIQTQFTGKMSNPNITPSVLSHSGIAIGIIGLNWGTGTESKQLWIASGRLMAYYMKLVVPINFDSNPLCGCPVAIVNSGSDGCVINWIASDGSISGNFLFDSTKISDPINTSIYDPAHTFAQVSGKTIFASGFVLY